MKKTKSIKLSTTYCIKPKQLRDALVATGNEYVKMPEFVEKDVEQWKQFLKNIEEGFQFKQFKEMAATINEQMRRINESGLPKMIKEIGERYAPISENYKAFLEENLPKPDVYPLLPPVSHDYYFPQEVIDEISEKSAEKIFKRIEENGGFKKSGKWSIFYTKDDVELKINKENGDVKLGKSEGNIAPGTQEYKVFLCLLESSSYIAAYKTLLKLMYPDKNFEGSLKEYQVDMWALNTVIRNIKKALGILPRKKATNKDIFRTLKKHKAYSLSLKI